MSACCRFGDRLAALVDGELGHVDRDRVLVHLTSCPDCRADVDAQRRLKRRLAHAETPDPSADLSRRLLALAEPGGPLPPARPHAPQGAGRAPYTCPPGRAPARRPPARAPRRGPARRLAGRPATGPGPGP
ncbi:MAG: anti-sigma factor family protein, partial [Actinomycetota bacterium]